MDLNPEVAKRIERVLSSQSIAVLGTSKDDEPYSSLVGFVVTDDLRELVFATLMIGMNRITTSMRPHRLPLSVQLRM